MTGGTYTPSPTGATSPRGLIASRLRDLTFEAAQRREIFLEIARVGEAVREGRDGPAIRGAATLRVLLNALERAVRARVRRFDGDLGRILHRLVAGGHWLGPYPSARSLAEALRLLATFTPLAWSERGRWAISLWIEAPPEVIAADLRRWREAKAGVLRDAAQEQVPGINTVYAAQRHAPDCAARSSAAYDAQVDRARGEPRVSSPALRGRSGEHPSHSITGPTHADLLRAVPRGRWVREAAIRCLLLTAPSATLPALRDAIAGDAGHRDRWGLLRGLRALASRGWLVEGPDGWTVAHSEPHPDLAVADVADDPSEERPSAAMVAHLARVGVRSPDRLSRQEARAMQRRLHARRTRGQMSPRQLRAIQSAGGDLRAARFRKAEDFPSELARAHAEHRHQLEVEAIREEAYSRGRFVAREAPVVDDGPVESKNWRRFLAAVERVHGIRAVYDLQVNAGGIDLVQAVNAASDDAIAQVCDKVRGYGHHLSVPRKALDDLLALAVDEQARAHAEREAARWAEIEKRPRRTIADALAEIRIEPVVRHEVDDEHEVDFEVEPDLPAPVEKRDWLAPPESDDDFFEGLV